MNDQIILDKFSERLLKLVKDNNTDINMLAKALGIKSKSTIYRYMNGEMSPKITTIKYLAEYFNVNELWLMGYDVPMQKENSNAFPVADEIKYIPVIGRISAGLPLFATENLEGYSFAPSSKLKNGYDYFYLIVKGDSMNLKFHDGDLVLVQRQDTLENDEIGVVIINGDDATVKKFKKENGLVILEPMSTNPDHTVQIYNPEKISVRIIGKVISYQGNV